MKKQKTTKRAFISSLISLALCVTMLVGTTFAWYTDSVTSGRNTIVAGSLDMIVQYYTGTIGDSENESFAEAGWKDVTDLTAVFDDSASFEPGAAQVAYVRVKNNGDLAFKYSLAIAIDSKTIGKNKAGQNLDLTDYLKFGAVSVDKPYRKSAAGRDAAIAAAGSANISSADFVTSAVLEAKDDANNKSGVSDVIALVVYMPSSLGNEVNPDPNNKPSVTFGLNALATQAVIENDSFSNTYDDTATLNFTPVSTNSALVSALEDGGNISVDNNIDTATRFNIEKDTTINGNGNTIKVNSGDNRVIDISDTTAPVTVALNNVNIDGSDAKIDSAYARGISLYGNKDVTLNAKGTTITSPYYAINVAGANEKVTINLENASVAAGWAGLNIWSKSTVNVKDSLISGTNDKTYNADGWNNFGTIVMNYDSGNSTNGSVLNFENTTIKGSTTTGNRQVLVDIRDDNITMNFTNCTFISEGTPSSEFADIMFYICMNEHITFTNCKFIKNGVEVDVKDYIGYYPGNNDDSSVIIVNGVALNNNDIPEISK